MTTVFITGGTGFLGRTLLHYLHDRTDWQLRVLTRTPERHQWLKELPRVETFVGDIRDAAAIIKAVEGCRYVVHAAAYFRFWGKQQQFEQTNVVGTKNVLDAAVLAGIEKFVHVSTVVVVGNPQTDDEIDETHPTCPVDAYQKTKLVAEQLALSYVTQHQLPVVVLRPGAFYGPYGHYAFNKMFFEDPLRGLRLGVEGGRYYTMPTYVEDMAQAIFLALEKGHIGNIYNIVSQYMTHREVHHIIADAAGISHFHIFAPAFVMVPFARVLTVLGRIFNFEPKYPLTLRS
ncbi:MAG: hypothetical protein CUN55_15205, partial [Phototrophicales bacterium]